MAEARAEAPPAPGDVELDRLLEDLWGATDKADGLSTAADLVGSHLLDSPMFKLAKDLQDGESLLWLLQEAKCATARAKRLLADVEERLGAGSCRPGGALHWRHGGGKTGG